MVFIDEVNRRNPLRDSTVIEAVNPCGEQPLEAWGVCCLASINLSAHVTGSEMDWPSLEESARTGVRLLDNAIDASSYPLPENEQMAKRTRKIGLGIMGLAHTLAKMGIPYDSPEAVSMTDKLMGFISRHAVEASRELARERGPFPDFEKSVYARCGELPRRHATLTTIAPTGTISIIADTSSGIEPVFALAYTRTALDGRAFSVLDPVFRDVAGRRGIYSDRLAEAVAKTGSIQDVAEIPEDLKAIFKTAREISARRHLEIQAAAQRHSENAVSKTINLVSRATVEDVEQIFVAAHALRCKGTTIFRQGSRSAVLSAGLGQSHYASVRERPGVTSGQTVKFRTGCGSLYVVVNRDSNGLIEAFSSLGKGGGCPASSEAVARLVSLCLRCNVNPREIIRQLQGIRCATACSVRAAGKPVDVLSCPDAIARAMGRTLGETGEEAREGDLLATCPRCGGKRQPGRCGVCLSCGEGGCEGA